RYHRVRSPRETASGGDRDRLAATQRAREPLLREDLSDDAEPCRADARRQAGLRGPEGVPIPGGAREGRDGPRGTVRLRRDAAEPLAQRNRFVVPDRAHGVLSTVEGG